MFEYIHGIDQKKKNKYPKTPKPQNPKTPRL